MKYASLFLLVIACGPASKKAPEEQKTEQSQMMSEPEMMSETPPPAPTRTSVAGDWKMHISFDLGSQSFTIDLDAVVAEEGNTVTLTTRACTLTGTRNDASISLIAGQTCDMPFVPVDLGANGAAPIPFLLGGFELELTAIGDATVSSTTLTFAGGAGTANTIHELENIRFELTKNDPEDLSGAWTLEIDISTQTDSRPHIVVPVTAAENGDEVTFSTSWCTLQARRQGRLLAFDASQTCTVPANQALGFRTGLTTQIDQLMPSAMAFDVGVMSIPPAVASTQSMTFYGGVGSYASTAIALSFFFRR